MPLTPARLAIASLAIAALYAVPYAGYALYPVLLAATALHELGHAAAVVVTGGTVDGLALGWDGSGATAYRGGAPAVIAAAGPLAPVAVGVGLIVGARRRTRVAGAVAYLGVALALAWIPRTAELFARRDHGAAPPDTVALAAHLGATPAVWAGIFIAVATAALAAAIVLTRRSRGTAWPSDRSRSG